MKLLVTGGAGFIGSNFIRYILRKYPNYEIVNLDKLTYAGNLDNLKDVEGDDRYEFVKGDICDEKIVDEVVGRGVDAILNYAAESHVDRSITGPKDFIMTEVIGTYNLLEAAKKHGVAKYVQISTDEVYGSIDEGAFTEETPYAPNSPYSASKAGGDHLCRAYHVTYGMPVVVTHSCNVYGPYQYPEKIIPLFATNILRGKKVPLYGDGKNVREWLYTEDHCRAIDVILHDGKVGEVYNIGSGYEISNVELTKMVLDELSVGDEAIEYVEDRLGHDRRYAIDFTKLKSELGWEPEVDFGGGLARTVEWYKENEWWWKKLI
ncbi:MAG: dTDP-glucose 4,6-dehydratase [Nitrospirota bacterium]